MYGRGGLLLLFWLFLVPFGDGFFLQSLEVRAFDAEVAGHVVGSLEWIFTYPSLALVNVCTRLGLERCEWNGGSKYSYLFHSCSIHRVRGEGAGAYEFIDQGPRMGALEKARIRFLPRIPVMETWFSLKLNKPYRSWGSGDTLRNVFDFLRIGRFFPDSLLLTLSLLPSILCFSE